MAPRLQTLYREKVAPELLKQFGLTNLHAVPRLTKITLNCGVGRAISENNPKLLEDAQRELTQITGQRAVLTAARKSIATFKIRDGYKVGVRVTVRGARMFDFFERLINIAMPRIRDFRGYSIKSFDGRGNYAFGIEEQTIFPEVDPDTVDVPRGMDICITTTSQNNAEGEALIAGFGFPFRDGTCAATAQHDS
jgi:large subunit ribosomal protein L5